MKKHAFGSGGPSLGQFWETSGGPGPTSASLQATRLLCQIGETYPRPGPGEMEYIQSAITNVLSDLTDAEQEQAITNARGECLPFDRIWSNLSAIPTQAATDRPPEPVEPVGEEPTPEEEGRAPVPTGEVRRRGCYQKPDGSYAMEYNAVAAARGYKRVRLSKCDELPESATEVPPVTTDWPETPPSDCYACAPGDFRVMTAEEALAAGCTKTNPENCWPTTPIATPTTTPVATPAMEPTPTPTSMQPTPTPAPTPTPVPVATPTAMAPATPAPTPTTDWSQQAQPIAQQQYSWGGQETWQQAEQAAAGCPPGQFWDGTKCRGAIDYGALSAYGGIATSAAPTAAPVDSSMMTPSAMPSPVAVSGRRPRMGQGYGANTRFPVLPHRGSRELTVRQRQAAIALCEIYRRYRDNPYLAKEQAEYIKDAVANVLEPFDLTRPMIIRAAMDSCPGLEAFFALLYSPAPPPEPPAPPPFVGPIPTPTPGTPVPTVDIPRSRVAEGEAGAPITAAPPVTTEPPLAQQAPPGFPGGESIPAHPLLVSYEDSLRIWGAQAEEYRQAFKEWCEQSVEISEELQLAEADGDTATIEKLTKQLAESYEAQESLLNAYVWAVYYAQQAEYLGLKITVWISECDLKLKVELPEEQEPAPTAWPAMPWDPLPEPQIIAELPPGQAPVAPAAPEAPASIVEQICQKGAEELRAEKARLEQETEELTEQRDAVLEEAAGIAPDLADAVERGAGAEIAPLRGRLDELEKLLNEIADALFAVAVRLKVVEWKLRGQPYDPWVERFKQMELGKQKPLPAPTGLLPPGLAALPVPAPPRLPVSTQAFAAPAPAMAADGCPDPKGTLRRKLRGSMIQGTKAIRWAAGEMLKYMAVGDMASVRELLRLMKKWAKEWESDRDFLEYLQGVCPPLVYLPDRLRFPEELPATAAPSAQPAAPPPSVTAPAPSPVPEDLIPSAEDILGPDIPTPETRQPAAPFAPTPTQAPAPTPAPVPTTAPIPTPTAPVAPTPAQSYVPPAPAPVAQPTTTTEIVAAPEAETFGAPAGPPCPIGQFWDGTQCRSSVASTPSIPLTEPGGAAPAIATWPTGAAMAGAQRVQRRALGFGGAFTPFDQYGVALLTPFGAYPMRREGYSY